MNSFKDIKNKLLFSNLPLSLSTITIDATKDISEAKSSYFFECIPFDSYGLDFLIGNVEGLSISANILLATAVKFYFNRLAKPSFPCFHFDKIRMWEKNQFPAKELISHLKNDIDSSAIPARHFFRVS